MPLTTMDKDRMLAAMNAAAWRVIQELRLPLRFPPLVLFTHDKPDRLVVEFGFVKEPPEPAPDGETKP